MQNKRQRPLFPAITRVALASGIFVLLGFNLLQATPPSWWSQRGVTNDQTPSDYSPINTGQLKSIASKAYDEMQAKLPGGAGPSLDDVIAKWKNPDGTANDYSPVNLGQVKNVGKLFYDRLIQIGYTSTYPWLSGTTPAADFSMANIGQVKNLFTFDFVASNNNSIPDWWEMKYFGNLNQSASGDFDGDGLTNLQEYLIGTNPVVPNAQVSGALNPNARTGRFTRGCVENDYTGTANSSFTSFVIPLDGEKGVPLDPVWTSDSISQKFSGIPIPWFTRIAAVSRKHINSFYDYCLDSNGQRNRIAHSYNPTDFENPIVSFGSAGGGSPLYLNQSYSFGVYAGGRYQTMSPVISITAYPRTSFVPGHTGISGSVQTITIPNRTDVSAWSTFAQNGFKISVQANGLTTDIQLVEAGDASNQWDARFDNSTFKPNLWDVSPYSPYVIRHSAATLDYYYKVEVLGNVPIYDGSNTWVPMVTNSTTQAADYSSMYTLDFEAQPAWRSTFIDRPQFTGSPVPPSYYGKTVEELQKTPPPLNIDLSGLSNPDSYKTLDQSPELRQHPILDQFVADMNNDPMALADYVLNEIDLTDAMDYDDSGATTSGSSVHLGGVNRGALATFLEGQGSPTEQCALLVYLLRKAGTSAVYMYPQADKLQMLDSQLSKLLRLQLVGEVDPSGTVIAPHLISVNYPWVAARINGQWVQIFPWLKDTDMIEGLDLYNYMPAGYNTGLKWVKNYIYGDQNILSLDTENNAPSSLFPKFIRQNLLINYPKVSLDDIGMTAYNRRNYHVRWSDFPRPFQISGTSSPVESLTSGTSLFGGTARIVSPDIFDTIAVNVSSDSNPSKNIDTGDIRVVDLHNRRLLIRHDKTAGSDIDTFTLNLSLEPFRPAATGTGAFGISNPTTKQLLQLALSGTDDNLTVTTTNKRHRSLTSGSVGISYHWSNCLGFRSTQTIVDNRPLRKGDLATICINTGRVSKDMIEVHALDFWQKQQSGVTMSPDDYQGTIAYLAGMSYYRKLSDFEDVCQKLHKIRIMSSYCIGLSEMIAKRNGQHVVYDAINGVTLQQPAVDMFFKQFSVIGNGTMRPDQGKDATQAAFDYNQISICNGSAEEHQVLKSFYSDPFAVSTVRLLQLAQAGASGGIIRLDTTNYQTAGQVAYGGTTKLADWAGSMWNGTTGASVQSMLSSTSAGIDAYYSTAYITPGPVTNESGSYKGMGALILGKSQWTALIGSNSLNGGYASYFRTPPAPTTTLNFDSYFNVSVTLAPPTPTFQSVAPDIAPITSIYQGGNYYDNSSYIPSPVQVSCLAQSNSVLGLPSNSSYGTTLATTANSGVLSTVSSWFSDTSRFVADPVQQMTGEFYIDADDLTLAGPMPLRIRRNYSSQNLANNQFGYGWKFAYMPYLTGDSGTANISTANIIYAAEMDGSVVAYRKQTDTNLFLPTAADNPQLENINHGAMGTTSNMFNARLVRTSGTGATPDKYTLTAPDGSVRTFTVKSFPVGSGSSQLTRQRPYLDTWRDNRSDGSPAHPGNSYSFSYGTDSTKPEYGQVTRIASSNGNFIGFYYDTYAHVTQAFANDGRRVSYNYDQYGDLVKVTLPDYSQIIYDYQHGTQKVTQNGVGVLQPYSYHLITRETKPGGRVLENDYDGQRRVTQQRSTVGPDLVPVRNASFTYNNNWTLGATGTSALVTGTTLVEDAYNRVTKYEYSGGLVTKITDPLNQAITQEWYLADDAPTKAYRRSLKKTVDKRGLTTEFQYDTIGNLVQKTVTGNLTGSGSGTALYKYFYNTNNMVEHTEDPVGNTTQYAYGNPFYPYLPTTIEKKSGSTSVSVTKCDYYDVIEGAKASYGLLQHETEAYGSSDQAVTDFAYNASGFLTSQTRHSGTSDPDVTTNFVPNALGQVVEQSDALGRKVGYAYDGRGNRIWTEKRDESSNLVDWEYSYYNQNGELTWTDGARFGPEDYVWRDYDGAGRQTQEIRWRSRAKTDGSGVEADTGDNLTATTISNYDLFGNQVQVMDPHHNVVKMSYDAIGQLTGRQVFDASTGYTQVLTEGFAHEPGGQISSGTNALGGVTQKFYTSTGQLKKQVNPDNSVQEWRYYLDGRLQQEILPNGATWTTSYNDATRTVTRVFQSGSSQVQEVTVYDRRGNVVSKTDVDNYTFATTYDGLNRVKTATGPANSGSPVQAGTHTYDAIGRVHTVTDSLGNQTITTSDMLGRPISVQVKNAGGSVVNQTSYSYSTDHHSVTTTVGTGTDAISSTQYSDTLGNPVLTRFADGKYRYSVFDVNSNVMQSVDELKRTTAYSYDALNHVVQEILPGEATTTFVNDAAGNIRERRMPGGTIAKTEFDTANRKTSEYLMASGTTRKFVYHYYTSQDTGSGSYIGRLKSVDDPRGFSSVATYDNFGRLQNLASTGSQIAEQNQTTTYGYNNRGLVTSVQQSYALATTGTATTVSTTYDGYGQKLTETVALGTGANQVIQNQWTQAWDAAGRRASLASSLSSLGATTFGYRADGLMTSSTFNGNSFNYAYADNGLLSTRTNDWRSSSVIRDSRGRITSQSTSVNGVNVLSESLAILDDSKIGTYTAVTTGTESRTYGYNDRGQLLSEPFLSGISGSSQTLTYQFDGDTLNSGTGAGVRTLTKLDMAKLYEATSVNSWQQVKTENNVQTSGTVPITWDYDSTGAVTSSSSSLQGIKTLTWDSFGRLVKVHPSSGLDWTAIYDGLGRRVRTTEMLTSGSRVIESYYDPQVEFLEVGISLNGTPTWKVYGPDLNGRYGGLQGIGGLEASYKVTTTSVFLLPVVNDASGNVVGRILSNVLYTNPVKVGSYGVLPGYTAPLLNGLSIDIPQASVWRGHRIDPTGFYYMGARYYDPASGRFLSPDPQGHAASMSLYDYCNGDPVNGLDPDGRCSNSSSYSYSNYTPQSSLDSALLNDFDRAVSNPDSWMRGQQRSWDAQRARDLSTGDPLQELFYAGADVGQHIVDFAKLAVEQLPLMALCEIGGPLLGGAARATEVGLEAAGAARAGVTVAERSLVSEAATASARSIAAKSASTYERVALQATQNADSSAVVLGKFSQTGVSYESVAKDLSATYFQLPAKQWSMLEAQLGKNNMWNINKTFLDQQWSAGKDFYFSHNPWDASVLGGSGNYFESEVLHLMGLGAKDFVPAGNGLWKAVR